MRFRTVSLRLDSAHRHGGTSLEMLKFFCLCSITGSSRVIASDTLPFARRMSSTSYRDDLHAALPRQWRHIHNGEINLQSSWGQTQGDSYELAAGTAELSSLRFGELSDDAIEDND